jgi:hypothetical protein
VLILVNLLENIKGVGETMNSQRASQRDVRKHSQSPRDSSLRFASDDPSHADTSSFLTVVINNQLGFTIPWASPNHFLVTFFYFQLVAPKAVKSATQLSLFLCTMRCLIPPFIQTFRTLTTLPCQVQHHPLSVRKNLRFRNNHGPLPSRS